VSRRGILWTVLVVLLVLLLVGVGIWFVYLAATAIAKIVGVIIAAVITLIGTLIAAIINHSLTIEAQQKQQELLAKQDNYKQLLATIGEFARNSANVKYEDALTSAHLASWAFGDPEVLACTNAFQKERKVGALVELLKAVRRSLEKPDLTKEWFERYHKDVLFTPKKRVETDGGLELGEEKPQAAIEQGQATDRDEEIAKLREQKTNLEEEIAKRTKEKLEADIAKLTADKEKLEGDEQHEQHLDQAEAPETTPAGSQEREPETGQNRTAYLTKRLTKREAADRGHASSHINAQPYRSPQVDASEDTETRKSPAPGNGGESDIRHAAGEEKHESTSRPFWKRILGIS
jgi:hypothetical protein